MTAIVITNYELSVLWKVLQYLTYKPLCVATARFYRHNYCQGGLIITSVRSILLLTIC